jgi:predicted ATPase/Tfp pilus assembly protein PilF/transcriptional regulator with XRE-family HTH domain
MEQSSPFGDYLRQLRVARKWTQHDLAFNANIAERTVSDLERGIKKRPRRDTVKALIAGFEEGGEPLSDAEKVHLWKGRAPATVTRKRIAPAEALPDPDTPFIGRDADLEAICGYMERGVRVVTLTGPLGVGTTRLAVEAAKSLRSRYPDGVSFLDLAAADTPARLAGTIMQALGLTQSGEHSPGDLIRGYLRDKQMLLVADDAQPGPGTRDLLAAVLSNAPRVQVLATGRTASGVSGEQVYPVDPLSLPARNAIPPLRDLERYGAVALFIDRARSQRPNLTITEENAAAIVEICSRLDGLPGPIEVIAARAAHASLRDLLGRLQAEGGHLLIGEAMSRTVDLSYSLLRPADQFLFRRFSVFEGGCSLDAVEAVCNQDGALGADALILLGSLIDTSLLRQTGDEESWYVMLETIRMQALAHLRREGEEEQMRDTHLAYFLRLAEEAEPGMAGPAQAEWLDRLEREHGNLGTALAWSLRSGRGEIALRLATALWRFWDVRGYWREGRQWLSRALDAAPDAPAELRARALSAAGHTAWRLADYDSAERRYREGLALFREIGDESGQARVLDALGIVAANWGRYEEGIAFLQESLAISRRRGDVRGQMRSLNNLGIVAANQGDLEPAETYYQESWDLKRRVGDRLGEARTIGNLALVVQQRGQLDRAAVLQEKSLELFQQLGDKRGSGRALADLAMIEFERGQYERARVLIGRSVDLFRQTGHAVGMAQAAENLAQVAAAGGHAELAAQLFGAAERARQALGIPLPPSDQPAHDRYVAAARGGLDDAAWATAFERGRLTAVEDAVQAGLLVPAAMRT